MLPRHDEPIVAIATAAGRGAVGIIRISGKQIAPLVQALCGRPLLPRQATYLAFKQADGQIIDQGLALFFPAPHSYTGEDVLELQAHGGQVVLQLLLARCLEAATATNPATALPLLAGLRLANAGEFTERAFVNDKIDLAQAEGIADLIDATTETAARSAARSLSGEFSQTVNRLLQQLVQLRMLVEATLDFPEEDIDFLQQADAQGQLQLLKEGVAEILQRSTQGAILREGIKVVIAGQPNVGKSSLLNALAGAEVAIVTPVAGTTRDKILQLIQIDGVPLHVVDTAGLRDTLDVVEKIGVQRAWSEVQTADVVLFLRDLTRYFPTCGELKDAAYLEEDVRTATAITQLMPHHTPVIEVWTKSDAVADKHELAAFLQQGKAISISATTGPGLQYLRECLLQNVGWRSSADGVFMARQRHIHALQAVQIQLQFAENQLLSAHPALDLLAEDLRQAQLQLGTITGAFGVDALLGEIFSKFCIGK